MTEVTATKAASANSKAPATRAALLSASPFAALARNLHSTTTAEKNSMALSPPKASSEGLLARHAATRDTAASTLIHAIVIACTVRTRRRVSGAMAWGARSFYRCSMPQPCPAARIRLVLLLWHPSSRHRYNPQIGRSGFQTNFAKFESKVGQW